MEKIVLFSTFSTIGIPINKAINNLQLISVGCIYCFELGAYCLVAQY